jgi:hypothetical protein
MRATPRTTRFWMVLGWLIASACHAQSAIAQTPAADVCRARGSGLAMTMKQALDLKTPKGAALQLTGLAVGGPRYRIADAAYSQLEKGATLDDAMRRATQLCLQIGADAVEDDEPTFETQREDGGGAQLCGDLASSVAGFLVDEPGAASFTIDRALERFRGSDPRDIPAPRERAALDIALRIARVRLDKKAISQAVFDHCEDLSITGRRELEHEFYVTD